MPVPAIISEETFEAAQYRLHRNVQMARRNNTTYTYLLRGLVSCGQCRLTCGGRTLHPGYHYYFCRGRTDALRLALGERCTARYAPAQILDALVWQDLCRVLSDPTLITHELERAQMGAWLPQALQARRQTLRDVLAQLERQQARLLSMGNAAPAVEGWSEEPHCRLPHNLYSLQALCHATSACMRLAQGPLS